jgi:chromosome segregation ATPase
MNKKIVNKNSIIGALAVLLIITSLWGQVQTGKRKALEHERMAMQEQVQANTVAVSERNTLQAEVAEQEKAELQMTSQLEETGGELDAIRQENEELKKEIAGQDAELNVLKAEKEKSMGVQQEQQGALQRQLEALQAQMKEQQAVIDENESQLTSTAHITQQIAAQGQRHLKELESTQAELVEAEGVIRQIQEKQADAAVETESLRAQVIGFEKVVEERNAALAALNSEMEDCRMNTKVLISKIADQENAQLSMQEKMRLMVQDLVDQEGAIEGAEQAAQQTQAEQQ